jgi:hypothetical protein
MGKMEISASDQLLMILRTVVGFVPFSQDLTSGIEVLFSTILEGGVLIHPDPRVREHPSPLPYLPIDLRHPPAPTCGCHPVAFPISCPLREALREPWPDFWLSVPFSSHSSHPHFLDPTLKI